MTAAAAPGKPELASTGGARHGRAMPKPVPQRLSASLPVIAAAHAAEARARIGGAACEGWGPAGAAFLDAAFSAAPYLARLATRRPDTLRACAEQSPEDICAAACAAARATGAAAENEAALSRALRETKADLHLCAALADLSGAWTLEQATAAISRFADAAVAGALHGLARFEAAAGRLNPPDNPDNPVPGLFVLALGKLGGEELNYSSDIDICLFFDPARLSLPAGREPKRDMPRLAQALVKLLHEPTEHGYVFRADLRLRPDASATPPAMSADAALNYYESLGQNWERAAYVKARPCAGDAEAARDFLRALEPFVWRRSLDFAAVEDIRALARQIQAVGRRAEIRAAGHDLKLGRGGIREIEFYAQVPQLVFGGRDPSLRARGTLAALAALAKAGKTDPGAAEALSARYRFLRGVEHRIQMLEDEPTQTLPADDGARACVAALCGEADLAAFDAMVREALREVHGWFSDQFAGPDTLASSAGSLVLTGVEPTPDTLQTISRLGFAEPGAVWARLNGWAAGRARAARSPRARTLLAMLAPRLLEAMAATGDADAAFTRFAAFFEGLPMGVQPLALLVNEPQLADELVAILGLAPRLAETLARRPATLDVMLDARFSRPLADDPADDIAMRMEAQMQAAASLEDAMNRARRLAREERFRIGAQVLRRRADSGQAGQAFADLADASVRAMAAAAVSASEARYGPPPGRFAVLGLGKLGGRELAADSDLDLMVVYEPEANTPGAETWFARFTQRLVSALSAPTGEGELYEADMQLRPSGKAGPVAVRLSSFESYYAEEAWTWERMALTRLRAIAGDAVLGARVEAAARAALTQPRDATAIRADAADMRARLRRDRPASGPWDLKLRQGGLTDIEFIAQTLMLIHAPQGADVLRPGTLDALAALHDAGALNKDEVETLSRAARLYLGLSQLIRTAHGSGFDPGHAAAGFGALIAGVGGFADFAALEAGIDRLAAEVMALLETHVGRAAAPATESGASTR
ncbi:MAG: bifunctional [glutamine synthetase] adenylyltransferase/[glutamine synthetase]-adenylyl-L-tyrosine phosphorylase [Maricaulaceae bacterium]|nr:bifunctional [glutamine synthetase] adenylyltransferase/[glutamine synthetase]-adenylyl-L-tyrosine phosphorylase [Maricaulaceae bacterium]